MLNGKELAHAAQHHDDSARNVTINLYLFGKHAYPDLT